MRSHCKRPENSFVVTYRLGSLSHLAGLELACFFYINVLFLTVYVPELLKWSDKIVPVKLPEF